MRVLIVDDHEVVRRGVRSLLESHCEVCGEAVDGQDAIEKARQLRPDVVVMDISMPSLNGLEATPLIRGILPDCEILILSQHESAQMVRQAFKAGARGYVVKSSAARDLPTAIETISKHESFFDPAIPGMADRSRHLDAHEILQRSVALERALRESEELYRSTFELTAVGVAHVNPDGRWLRVNKKLCEIVGYSESELMKLTFQDITHPEDLNRDLGEAEKIKAGVSDRYSIEKRYLRKDGTTIWINLAVSAVRDASGKLKHFITVVEDINERRILERVGATLASELDLKKVVQVATDAGRELSGAGFGAFFYNVLDDKGESYMLYTLSGAVPEDFSKFPMPRNTCVFAPTFKGESTLRLDDVAKDERYGKNPPYYGMPSGHLPVRSYLAVPVKSRPGEVLGGLFYGHPETGVFTERAEQLVEGLAKHAAIAIDNARLYERATSARTEADASAERLRLAQQVANVGTFEWNITTGLNRWTPELEKMYGLPVGGFAGTQRAWEELVHPEDREETLIRIERAMKEGTFEGEWRVVWPDGSVHWMLGRASVLKDRTGNPERLVGVNIDVTERKQLEEALHEEQSNSPWCKSG